MRWYYPGGDVDRLRQCAAACTALATTVHATGDRIEAAGKATLPHFKGKAAAALETDLSGLISELTHLGDHLRSAANALTQHADVKVQQARESHILWVLTAVAGLVLAGEAIVAVDVAALETLTQAEAGVAELLPRIAKSHVLYTGIYLGSQFIVKFMQGMQASDPSTWGSAMLKALDPNNYSAADLAIVLYTIPMDVAQMVGLKALGVLDTPLTGAAAVASEGKIGGTANGAAAGYGALVVAGKSVLDPSTWLSIGWAAGLGYLGGVGAAKWAEPIAGALSGTSAGKAFDSLVGANGARIEDFARTVLTLPADVSVSAATSSGPPPSTPSIDPHSLTAPAEPEFQPHPAEGQSVLTPVPTPGTLWTGNVDANPDDLRLLQQRLAAHGLPSKVGDPWEKTASYVGWFKAANGFWTTPESPNDHAVTPEVWQKLLS
jgi:hypothetical protein